jgi:hypothetical protein
MPRMSKKSPFMQNSAPSHPTGLFCVQTIQCSGFEEVDRVATSRARLGGWAMRTSVSIA